MLRIIIELWPRGDEQRKKLLYVADLYNDGTGTHERGNYGARFYRKGSECQEQRGGNVRDFPRLRKNAWSLLGQMLKDVGYI